VGVKENYSANNVIHLLEFYKEFKIIDIVSYGSQLMELFGEK